MIFKVTYIVNYPYGFNTEFQSRVLYVLVYYMETVTSFVMYMHILANFGFYLKQFNLYSFNANGK